MSVKIYPVQKSEEMADSYEVSINGQKVITDTARVSAVPFNRRWPGHQRQLEQTELISFLSFACQGETVIEVRPKAPFEDFVIRPRALQKKAEKTENGSIKITLEQPAYFTVEPFGRQNALHIFADPMVEYCAQNTEEVLYYGEGVYEVGLLELKSNQTLILDEGAVVYGSVFAKDAENIRIIGHGILDNSHNKEEILFSVKDSNNQEDVGNAYRRHTIELQYCENVEIDGITIRDSLVYNIRPTGCKNLTIKNVKIIGCWRFNSDGIDMHNCQNVEIGNCFLRTFDDSICVKGFDFYYADDPAKATYEATYHNGKVYDCFKNVWVHDCVIWNDWGKCLEIGAETRGREICDIRFENCDIIHVNSIVLSCANGDNAVVHDVHYENIRVEYDREIPAPLLQKSDDEVYVNPDKNYTPTLIGAGVQYFPEYAKGVPERGHTRDFTYRNIRLYGRQVPKVKFVGFDAEHRCENMVIEDLYWNDNKVEFLEEIEYIQNAFCDNILLK